MEKSGPQPSSKSGSPENGWFSTERGEYRWPYSTYSGEINWKRSEWRVPVAHHHFDSPFQGLEASLEKVRVMKSNRDGVERQQRVPRRALSLLSIEIPNPRGNPPAPDPSNMTDCVSGPPVYQHDADASLRLCHTHSARPPDSIDILSP